MRSFTFSCAQEIDQMIRFRLLNFFVLNSPIVVLVKESEDLSEIFGLFLKELIEDVEFSPFDFLIVVEIISLQKFSLQLSSFESLKVIRVRSSFEIASALLNHFQD